MVSEDSTSKVIVLPVRLWLAFRAHLVRESNEVLRLHKNLHGYYGTISEKEHTWEKEFERTPLETHRLSNPVNGMQSSTKVVEEK